MNLELVGPFDSRSSSKGSNESLINLFKAIF